MATISVDKCLAIASRLKYVIFSKPYELNIWGVRSGDSDTSKFNDTLFIFYKDTRNLWQAITFKITTDPSNMYLFKPINTKGAAIVKSGQYRNVWAYGLHRNKPDHKALIQVNNIKVYRDNNKDEFKNFNEASVDEGLFGINMHRASKWGITKLIGAYGAGCQVHEDYDRYTREFLPLIENSKLWGNKLFTYTLITENML